MANSYRNRKTRKGPSSGNGMGKLTNVQKGAISATAAKAYQAQSDLGLTDDLSLDDWRRLESVACVGKRVSQASQRDYLKLQAHFDFLAGNKKGWSQKISKSSSRKPKTQPRETKESAGQYRHLIANALKEHHAFMVDADREAEEIAWPYVHTITRGKFAGRKLIELEASETEQILSTINNRIAAKEGRGAPVNRNKKQRHQSRREKGIE